jgi:ribosomal protein S18 acetylase RimI-like enzyme
MNNIEIREATTDDLQTILDLYAQPSMDDGKVLPLDKARAVLAKVQSNPDHFLYVATINSEIIGSFAIIVVQLLSHSGDRMGILEDVVVRTDYQGKGIGKIMMQFANEKCIDLNCYKIMLSSGEAREQAHAFYEKLGFKKHGYSFYLPVK